MWWRNRQGITENPIWKQILIFFFPILLGTFFQQLYNTVDAVVVGRFVGKEALAAVGGSTGTVTQLLIGFFTGLSAGATVVISQAFGAEKQDEVFKAVHTAMALSLAVGVFFMAAGLLFSPMALRAMATPESVMGGAVTYIRVYFAGILFPLIYNMGAGILRAVGDSRRPLYFLMVCCGANIILDIILVAVLKMGILGAALATLFSQAASACLTLIALARTDQCYQLDFRSLGFTLPVLKNIVWIGLPTGLQSVMYSVSNIIIQAGVNSLGTDVIAAWTAYGKIDGLYWMILSAFGVSVTTFVGHNFGAHNYKRMRETVRACLWMSMIGTVIFSAVLYGAAPVVFRVFTSDPNVISVGMGILYLLAPCYITYIAIEILGGAVRGTGDAVIPMIMTCVGVCVLRVLWIIFVVPYSKNIETIALSYPITWSVTSVLFIIYYRQGGWLKRRIAIAGAPPEELPEK